MAETGDLLMRLRAMYSHRGDGIPTQFVTPDGPEAADALERLSAERERVGEAETLFRMLIANEDEAPGGLLDCVDNDGQHYQSATMAGLMTHIRGWLPGNSVADRVAAYRTALAQIDAAGRGRGE